MNKKPLISIKQRHEDCHYETTFWKDGIPICCGRGITKEKADTEALINFLKGDKDEDIEIFKFKEDKL